MATYAIGDVQGCYGELCRILERVDFNPAQDRLWLVGDLINRGRENLQVLRLIMSFGPSAVTVLGNHDLHFLAICLGGHKVNRGDTFQDVLAAPDCDAIARWYLRQPLLLVDADLGYAMVHAGIPHLWSLETAGRLAKEVESVLRSDDHRIYFEGLYGNRPARWQDDLTGMDRWRLITNYFTRMRLLHADGALDFSHKGALADAPAGLIPWFELRAAAPLGVKLLFGHWAAIEGQTGHADLIGLDTGCVWGRSLTALCLETGEYTEVQAIDRHPG